VKIAFVVHTFFPNWRAGTEVYARSLARKVIENGHEAVVVCYEPPSAGEFFEEIRASETIFEGLRVHRISFCKLHRFHFRDYFHEEVQEYLFSYFAEIKPDIVHVVHAMHLSTASIWAAKRLGIPVVATATDFWYICPTYQLVKWDESLCSGPRPLWCLACVSEGLSGQRVRRLAARPWVARAASFLLMRLGDHAIYRNQGLANLLWLARRPDWMRATLSQIDILLTPTHNTTGLIQIHGLKPKVLRTSSFGVETHVVPDSNAARRGGVLRVGYMGTFRRSKGLHVVLQAIGRLPADKVALEVYGATGHFPDYDKYIRELAVNLPNVAFLGTFPNEKLPQVFGGLDVLVIPSLWHENSPLVLLSAFALKTPPVVSNIGSLADLVKDGKSGLVFEMGNAEDLASKLKTLIDEPQLLEQLRVGIPEVRTIDQNIDELLEIYGRLCSQERAEEVSFPKSLPGRSLRWGAIFMRFKMLMQGAQFRGSLALLRCAVVTAGNQLGFDFEWHASKMPSDWEVMIDLVDAHGEVFVRDHHRLLHYEQDPWGFLGYRYVMFVPPIQKGKDFRIRIGVVDRKTNTPLGVIRARSFRVDLQGNAVLIGSTRLAPAAEREQSRKSTV
jgi:glycosyltransferase involved in cell wall biosynthesis